MALPKKFVEFGKKKLIPAKEGSLKSFTMSRLTIESYFRCLKNERKTASCQLNCEFQHLRAAKNSHSKY